MENKPERVVDPVCGMSVRVAVAEADGLTHEHQGRIYAFCREGCLGAFRDDPTAFATAVDTAPATASGTTAPAIDEGMRAWYENCSCCLSDVYPEIKAQLDAERAAAAQPAAGAGICEVADAAPAIAGPAAPA